MNLLLFIMMLVGSFIIVRIGAIAFELTGLEWQLAKFQSLSCFSGTGFTTREAELVVGNPQRRRIASVLMVLGNAGLVTLVATFANTLRPETQKDIAFPFFNIVIPASALPWINLIILAIVLNTIWRLSQKARLVRKLNEWLRAHLIKNEVIKQVSFEELVVATGGYGVSQIKVCNNSPVLDKSLRETSMRNHDITVLAIVRGNETIPNPHPDMKISIGDNLVCFGKLDHIRKEICVVPA